MSPDARHFRFTLRAGIVYSDGTPVVAADIAASLERARTLPDSPYGGYLADVRVDRRAAPHRARHRPRAPADAAFV